MTVKLAPSIATEAAWLYKGGWPLYALVDKYGAGAPLDEQTNCLATAVYFEARGEALEGQLAVARVVMNRAASGRYPPTGAASSSSRRNSPSSATAQFPTVDTEFDCMAQGRGDRPARGGQCRSERRPRRPLVPCRLCRAVVGPPPQHGRDGSARTSSTALNPD